MAESGHLDDVDYLYAVHVGLTIPPVRSSAASTASSPCGTSSRSSPVSRLTRARDQSRDETRCRRWRRRSRTSTRSPPRRRTDPCERRARRRRHGDERHPRGVVYRGRAPRRDDRTGRVHVPARRPNTGVGRRDARLRGGRLDEGRGAERDERRRALAGIVGEVAGGVAGVTEIVDRADLGGSEGRHLPDAVGPEARGLACYVGVGTDHPGGHHTSTFDVVESRSGSRSGSTRSRARSERSPRRGPQAGREQPKSNVGFCRTPIFKL